METKKGFTQEELTTLFQNNSDNVDVKFGTVVIEAGERVPKEGFSVHEGTEYSFIVEGEVEGESGGKPFKVGENDATLFPAGEQHWTINASDKPCKIIFMLVEEK